MDFNSKKLRKRTSLWHSAEKRISYKYRYFVDFCNGCVKFEFNDTMIHCKPKRLRVYFTYLFFILESKNGLVKNYIFIFYFFWI